jgi:hypothetical protein
MDTNKHELVIPPKAASNPEAIEFIRAWKVGEAMHVSLDHSAWRQPAAWGIALADIVQHFADACEKSEGWPREEIIKQVATMFNAELNNPTDKPTGEFLK